MAAFFQRLRLLLSIEVDGGWWAWLWGGKAKPPKPAPPADPNGQQHDGGQG
jgi:hypothetical protein